MSTPLEAPCPGTRPPARREGTELLGLLRWVVVSNLARQGSILAVHFLLFERLSRSTYGAIALGFGYFSVFGGLGEMGIRQIAWREVARRPGRVVSLTTSFLSAKTATGTAALALYLLLTPWLWESSVSTGVILFFGAAIVLNGGTFEFPLHGLKRMDLVARYSSLAWLLFLAVTAAFVHDDPHSWRVPASLVGAMGILLALELRWFRREIGPFRLRLRLQELQRIVAESWPLGLGETLNRLVLGYPVILLGAVAGSTAVGDYRIAELAYSFLAQFGHLLATAAFSQVSYRARHTPMEVRRLLLGLLASMAGAACFAGTLLTLLGPTIARFALGGRMSESTAEVLEVLGLALCFAGPVRLLKGLLPTIDRQNLVPAVNAVALAVGVGIGWPVGARFGIVGMGWAVLFAEAASLVWLLAIFFGWIRNGAAR